VSAVGVPGAVRAGERPTERRQRHVGSVGSGSGVAGPLAARSGGQICRPFVLGFGNWKACLKYKSML